MINNVYPVFSDCPSNGKPEPEIMHYLNRNLQLGLSEYDNMDFKEQANDLMMDIMISSLASANSVPATAGTQLSKDYSLRSFFDKSLVLVARPGNNPECNMSVALKGGNNKEHHNHNDVGSYNIVVGKTIISGDPGMMPYTANIFDNKYRYTYKTIASYGHPLPLVAGKQQEYGEQAQAKPVRQNFTENRDELAMDIRSAYNVPELIKLERSFVYDRTGKGSFKITDNFAFTAPLSFETAIITRAKWEQKDEHTLFIQSGTDKIEIKLDASHPFRLKTEAITNEGKPYTRIAIVLDRDEKEGSITVVFNNVKF
jgi:hypothetical protein